MRKGVFAAGLAVLVIGAAIVGVSFLAASVALTIPNPSTGESLTFSPNLIGSGTVSLSWSQATSQFRFSIYQCSNSGCTSIATSPVANGAGASGTVSFPASGGEHFVVEAKNNAISIPVTIRVSGGLTPLLLIGIAILAVGALLAFVGYRAKAKPKVVYEEDVAPQRELFRTTATPFTGVQSDTAAAASGARTEYRPEEPEATKPVFYQAPEGQESYGSNEPAKPAAPAAGARPPVKCSSCGAMNEPWITNCRKCRRPLSTTG